MILPIYVSLEKIDLRLTEAARTSTARVPGLPEGVLPLSLPGVFAGSLLTFIPAAGDFLNAKFLGGPNNTDDRHGRPGPVPGAARLPQAAALSFVLMVIITIGVLVYAKLLGTDDLV